MKKCDTCRGDGVIPCPHCESGVSFLSGSVCTMCDGHGLADDCAVCGGTGELKEDDDVPIDDLSRMRR
jgi:DnaJ-class molecular chaperone